MSRNPKRKDGGKTQDWMVRSLDDLKEFDQLKAEILPKVREMLKKGKKRKEILEFAADYAAARLITLTFDEDTSKALVASKDILDRADGKATESKTVTHKYDGLSDEELIALRNSKRQERLAEDDDKTEH